MTTNQKDSSAKTMADTVQRLQGEPAAAVAKLSQDSSATSGDLDKLEALANAGAPVALRAETLRDLIDLARRATPAPQAATPLPGQDERVLFESAEHEFKRFHQMLCERFGYVHDERDWRRDQLSLIEYISAQVRQRGRGGDPAEPRDDSDTYYDRPIGYLPAYELSRLNSGHDANLRSAKFGPSILDGDVPVYIELAAAPSLTQQAAPGAPAQHALTVWYGPMPESNGKSNFTAILMRKDGDKWDRMADGITIDLSEYPDRVRYEADRVRYLIGELADRPGILDYDADKHSGYVAPVAAPVASFPMILHCPKCGVQHIDAPDERTEGWVNPPHRSHLCHGCGNIWRPADVPTEGVAAIQTCGTNDSAPEAPASEQCTYPNCSCIGGGVFKPCVKHGAPPAATTASASGAEVELAKLAAEHYDRDSRDIPALVAWERYRIEQTKVIGMAGLHAIPSFIAGFHAGRAQAPSRSAAPLAIFELAKHSGAQTDWDTRVRNDPELSNDDFVFSRRDLERFAAALAQQGAAQTPANKKGEGND